MMKATEQNIIAVGRLQKICIFSNLHIFLFVKKSRENNIITYLYVLRYIILYVLHSRHCISRR